MSNNFNEFMAGFGDDKDPKEDIMKVLGEIDRYTNGASYGQLLSIMPDPDTLKFHIEFQKECGFITETEEVGERVFETTALGKDVLDAGDQYSALDDLGVPDVSKVIIDQSAEEKILFHVYGDPKKEVRGDLYGYINPLEDGRINIEIIDAEIDAEIDEDEEKNEGLDVVGFYRSERPVGYVLRKYDVDELLQSYDEHLIVMCIDSEETGESAYQFWGANTEKVKGNYFKIPHDVRIGE